MSHDLLTDKIDINAVIDDAPMTLFQFRVLFLCMLTMILEGYVLYSVSYVGPDLMKEWGLAPERLAIVFTAGILGSAVANMGVGPIADRIGRRNLIIVGVASFGLAALLSATATSPGQFIFYRVLAGFGLGVTLPNVVSLAAEYAPRRWRAFAVVVVYSGFSAGASIGGIVAGLLMPTFPWPSIFIAGGGASLLLAIVMIVALPESIRFLALRRPGSPRLRPLLERIAPAGSLPANASFLAQPEGSGRQPVADLFHDRRVVSTLMIWVVIGFDAAALNVLMLWLPTLGVGAGSDTATATQFLVVMLLSGIVGAIVVGYAMDRLGSYRVLIPLKMIATAAVVALGVMLSAPPLALAVLIGVCLAGGIAGAQGLLAKLYPTAIRATGVGWAVGISRFVGFLAPLAVGWLVGIGMTPQLVMGLCAVPVAMVVLALITLSMDRYGRAAASTVGHG